MCQFDNKYLYKCWARAVGACRMWLVPAGACLQQLVNQRRASDIMIHPRDDLVLRPSWVLWLAGWASDTLPQNHSS